MIHLEGATLIQLNNDIENDVIGPSTKDYEKVFYNPAMSGSRTRSIGYVHDKKREVTHADPKVIFSHY